MRLIFVVLGVPQPKGSGSKTRSGVYIEDGTAITRKAKKAWRAAIEREATETLLAQTRVTADTFPVATFCKVDVSFYMPIPKSRTKGKRRLEKGTPHTQTPDIDKLARAVLDPLKVSGIVKDDSVISELVCRKIWCEAGYERAEITITF